MEEIQRWIEENYDDRGNKTTSNVSVKQRIGMKKLKERIENGSAIVVPTDKSGKFAIMPLCVYEEMGMVQIEGDEIINEEQLTALQRELNNHLNMFQHIFNICATHGEHNIERIRSGFTTEANSLAVLWLMSKDHKVVPEGFPIPSRPLVSITNTRLARLSRLVRTVVKALANNIGGTTEVKSCENLKADMIKTNHKIKMEKMR